MRVSIGCGGRFHAFDLARQMNRLGRLERLYTGYPRWKVSGLPKEKVSTFPWFVAQVHLADATDHEGERRKLVAIEDLCGKQSQRRRTK